MAGNMATYPPTSHSSHRTPRSSHSQSAHSYRIEKPKSNHNSPRTMERRRTTTGTKFYATLDDHYNMMMGITGDDDDSCAIESQPEPITTRPSSWHPSSTQYRARCQSTLPDHAHRSSQDYFTPPWTPDHSSGFYSLSARNSLYAEASQHLPTYTSGYEAHQSSRDSQYSCQTQQSYDASSYSTPASEAMPWYLQEWARKNEDQVVHPHFELPIQQPADPADEETDASMEDSGRELIGMGLYDLPDTSLDWASSVGEATGKGLKLEETWVPPEQDEDEDEDEDEDDDDDDDDDVSSDDDEESLPLPPAAVSPVVPAKVQPTGNLDGQSFFFEGDDTVTKEWWYQPLQQPSIPVRDAGYGYGWL